MAFVICARIIWFAQSIMIWHLPQELDTGSIKLLDTTACYFAIQTGISTSRDATAAKSLQSCSSKHVHNGPSPKIADVLHGSLQQSTENPAQLQVQIALQLAKYYEAGRFFLACGSMAPRSRFIRGAHCAIFIPTGAQPKAYDFLRSITETLPLWCI